MSHYLPATIDLLPLRLALKSYKLLKSGYCTLKFVTLSRDHDKLITLVPDAWSFKNAGSGNMWRCLIKIKVTLGLKLSPFTA